jgi:hypothetical protein
MLLHRLNWFKREIDRRVQMPPCRIHGFGRSLVTHLAKNGADAAVLDSMHNHAASVARAV